MPSANSIASYATNLSHIQLKQQVGYAMARKSLDVAKQQGQAAIQLLESAAQISRQSTAKGPGLDVRG